MKERIHRMSNIVFWVNFCTFGLAMLSWTVNSLWDTGGFNDAFWTTSYSVCLFLFTSISVGSYIAKQMTYENEVEKAKQ